MTQGDLRAAQAGSFGQAADIYEQARPSYPQESLDFLLDGVGDAGADTSTIKVVDLGAGTGKFTRLIAARGVDVSAVEPSDGMRERLSAVLPDVAALKGTAEQIPLDDDTVDAVLAAQAWHWVDVPRASVEVARVLKPGGRLGLIWNQRDERVDWVARLGEITKSGTARTMESHNPLFGEPFGQIEYHVTTWNNPITPQGLVDLVASRSYVIVADESTRERILGGVRDLAANHSDLKGRESFHMPYVTYASRAHVK